MKINRLEIQGFKSFSKKQIIDFSSISKGFYFVTGENLVETGLGANGCGKSTAFVDSLCYVLYGKTSNKLKASKVKNWISDENCEILLEFEKNNNIYTLLRTWEPNKLVLKVNEEEYKTVTQDELEELIGIKFPAFVHSMVVSQFGQKFFDLDPAQKLEIFSDILNLDCWLKYSETAKTKAKEIEKEAKEIEKDIEFLKGSIKELKNVDYTEEIKTWKNTKKQQIQKLIEENEKNTRQEHSFNVELNSSQDLLEDLTNKLILKESIDNRLNVWYNKLETKLFRLNAELKLIRKGKAVIQDEKVKFKEVGEQCPYCFQDISKKHLEKCSKVFDTKNLKLVDEEAELLLMMGKFKKRISRLAETRLHFYEDKITSLKRKAAETSSVIRQLKINLNTVKVSLEYNEKNIKGLKDETNPFLELMEKNKKQLNKQKNDHLLLAEFLISKETDFNYYKYWVSGFKQIRLFIIEEALKEFEVRVNNYLSSLGLTDWRVFFNIDSPTKSKTIKKGFSILVKSPFNEEIVPFECWSGGESQRLRIAGTLGLANLIKDRTNCDYDIMVLDEPTQWLSEEGIDNLLALLEMYRKENNLKIFLIDHRNFCSYGAFDGIIKISKTEEGSIIEDVNNKIFTKLDE